MKVYLCGHRGGSRKPCERPVSPHNHWQCGIEGHPARPRGREGDLVYADAIKEALATGDLLANDAASRDRWRSEADRLEERARSGDYVDNGPFWHDKALSEGQCDYDPSSSFHAMAGAPDCDGELMRADGHPEGRILCETHEQWRLGVLERMG